MQMKSKGIVRYPHLIKASAPKDTDTYFYSVNLLIHKSDPEVARIQKLMDETIANSYPKGVPANFISCFNDLAITEPENSALSNYMCLKIKSKAEFNTPTIVDKNKQPIMNPNLDNEITGFMVWVAYGLGCWKHAGKNGINAYLNAVLVTEEKGPIPVESISSKPSVEAMFDGIDEDEPYTAPKAPVSGTVMTPPPPVPSPVYQMTDKAAGHTRESLIAIGWTDATLISQGMMLPPSGVTPSWES